MELRSPSFAISPRGLFGALRGAAPSMARAMPALRVVDSLDLTRVSVERMEEVADAWRRRSLDGDVAADLVADVLESVANQRRAKAARSRVQAIRLGLAALTKY